MNMFAKLSMKFEAQLQRFAIRGIVGLIALLFSVPGWSAQAQAAAGAQALTNWQAALASFQKIGALIGEGKYAPAKLELRSGATNLPPPYRVMAAQYLEQLEGALQHSSGKKDHRQLSALLELSAELRAYPAALQLITRLRKASREDEDPQSHSLAWLLLENGQTKAALAQYERKLAQEHIEIWQSYCRKQMELIGQRPANMTNVQFALEYVREHYLKGYEEKADHLSALKELTRILGCARNSQASLAVLHLMMKCFSALDDQAGLEAWEDKVLTDFKSDRDACAGVYLDRGLRAYGRKNLSEALDFFRKICAEYPDTASYGDAQYDIGLALHDQQKYDEAISEYTKLFSSPVNDYVVETESSEDMKNYRYKAAMRISECYEAQKDYARALEYAELARDRYKYLSWCKGCLQNVRNDLDKRIKLLQGLAPGEQKTQ